MRHLAIFFTALATTLYAQEPFTYETDDALFSTGDFNGDTHTDLVVVDKNDGTYAVGFAHAADNGFDWSPQHPSGFASPSGLAFGKVEGGLGVFSITASEENRITLFAVLSPGVASPLSGHLFPSGPASHSIAGFDIDGLTSTDYLVAGESGAAGAPYYLEGLDLGNSTPPLFTVNHMDRAHRVWSVLPRSGDSAHAVIARGNQLKLVAISPNNLVDLSTLSGYTATDNTRLTYGFFGTNTFSHAFAYERSQTTATVSRFRLDGVFGFFNIWGSPATLTFPKPLKLLTTVNGRLAALFTDGTAATYDFDGTTLSHRSNLPGTQDLLAPIGGDSFLSLQGSTWQRWDASSAAATLSPVISGVFPATGSGGNAATTSNIVFANAEPFVDPDAKPLFFGHVRDWTVTAIGMDRDWDVTSLSQMSTGLGNSATFPFDPDDDDADHALVNQVAENISFRLLDTSVFGKPVGDVAISPPAGTYPPLEALESHTIHLATNLDNATIYYHYSPINAWFVYNPNNPPALPAGTSSATIETYAENATSRTPTRRAAYNFADSAPLITGSLIDLDGDGLPDQWEDAFNAYNPFDDDDGDGENNLAEYQNCTDPRDSTSMGVHPLVLESEVVGHNLRLEWSLSLPAAVLEHSSDMISWAAITTGITTASGKYRHDAEIGINSQTFFRLRQN